MPSKTLPPKKMLLTQTAGRSEESMVRNPEKSGGPYPGHFHSLALWNFALVVTSSEALDGPRDWWQFAVRHTPDIFP